MLNKNLVLEGMKVLLVDDTPANITILRKILELEKLNISVAPSGEIALELAPKIQPDLILMDVMMPGIDGYETCRRLKEIEETSNTPVIFVTAKDQGYDSDKAFSSGGIDYITKPVRRENVIARVRVQLSIRALNKQRDELIAELLEANKKLDLASKTDPLTGLSNRRDLNGKLDNEINRYKRSQKPFSVIICDIDHFKKFNDDYGHDVGDDVLKHTARVLTETCRAVDFVGRWGGEEFLVISPETGLPGAVNLAEKLRASIEQNILKGDGAEFKITMSFGVSEYRSDKTANSVLKEADENLYKAKEQGRNRVISGLA